MPLILRDANGVAPDVLLQPEPSLRKPGAVAATMFLLPLGALPDDVVRRLLPLSAAAAAAQQDIRRKNTGTRASSAPDGPEQAFHRHVAVLGRRTTLPQNMRLLHGAASREHVVVECLDGAAVPPAGTVPAVRVTAVGRNSTFVNGKELPRGRPTPLRLGDRLSFFQEPPLAPTSMQALQGDAEAGNSRKRPRDVARGSDAQSPARLLGVSRHHPHPPPVFVLTRRSESPQRVTRSAADLSAGR